MTAWFRCRHEACPCHSYADRRRNLLRAGGLTLDVLAEDVLIDVRWARRASGTFADAFSDRAALLWAALSANLRPDGVLDIGSPSTCPWHLARWHARWAQASATSQLDGAGVRLPENHRPPVAMKADTLLRTIDARAADDGSGAAAYDDVCARLDAEQLVALIDSLIGTAPPALRRAYWLSRRDEGGVDRVAQHRLYTWIRRRLLEHPAQRELHEALAAAEQTRLTATLGGRRRSTIPKRPHTRRAAPPRRGRPHDRRIAPAQKPTRGDGQGEVSQESST